MTLKEYLESYDKPLNEKINDYDFGDNKTGVFLHLRDALEAIAKKDNLEKKDVVVEYAFPYNTKKLDGKKIIKDGLGVEYLIKTPGGNYKIEKILNINTTKEKSYYYYKFYKNFKLEKLSETKISYQISFKKCDNPKCLEGLEMLWPPRTVWAYANK